MMEWCNRLLSVLLTLAIAQFGALATAPAHAHEAGAHHAVHAVESPSGLILSAEDHHGHPHDQPSDPADDERDKNRSGQSGTEPLTHVHPCPQFTQTSAQTTPVVALAFVKGTWPVLYAGPPTLVSAPPLRPPRNIL